MAVVEVVCVNKNLRALSISGSSGHQRLARRKALDREDASLMLGKSLIHEASTQGPTYRASPDLRHYEEISKN
jgi:hypothetical protein